MMDLMGFMFFMMFLVYQLGYWNMQLLLLILLMLLMMKFSFSYEYLYMGWGMGMDLLSFMMIMLSVFIVLLMVLASNKFYLMNNYCKLFMFNMLLMLIMLVLTFSVLNLFLFYLFFEVSILPVLFMVLGWGYQPERMQAGIYLLFYTLFGSLPMMISLFYYFYMNNSLSFIYFIENIDNVYMYLCMNIVFFIKMPMYLVHLWLPKAHVEAPIAGSMILAGVLLKLGSYGVFRIMKLFLMSNLIYGKYFILISLMGGFLISILCISQVDMKSLIAYSSVSHMGMLMSGSLTLNMWGMMGGFSMMIAHGLCSSGLFCLANIYYERTLSRNLFLNKGLISVLPSMSLFMFLFSVANMAAPSSLNLLSEIILLISLIIWNKMLMILLMFMLFFSAVYSLYLYSCLQHGVYYSGIFSVYENKMSEYLLMLLHFIPLYMLFLKGEYFSLWF
uniref:NADH-ubiquinone oxidoreductase chain 4 n=1 Tax=Leptaulax koreanus TaxID=2607329 RepID=A0A5C0XRH7_9SCAR|nr:NADH dehydrogenase subunit 4 [Leptaulax koreanus]QEK77360.1 NADH dehydrogenase subunit 4 [Leptaulax koreanus]